MKNQTIFVTTFRYESKARQPAQIWIFYDIFSPGRNGDWIRVASTSDLWGVEYSAEAKMSVAAVPHSAPAVQSEPSDDSSVWVPIASWAKRSDLSTFLLDILKKLLLNPSIVRCCDSGWVLPRFAVQRTFSGADLCTTRERSLDARSSCGPWGRQPCSQWWFCCLVSIFFAERWKYHHPGWSKTDVKTVSLIQQTKVNELNWFKLNYSQFFGVYFGVLCQSKVTLKARRSRQSPEWSVDFLRCPASCRSPGSTRQRQKERLHWRAATWTNQDEDEVHQSSREKHDKITQNQSLDRVGLLLDRSEKKPSSSQVRVNPGAARILWQQGFTCNSQTWRCLAYRCVEATNILRQSE